MFFYGTLRDANVLTAVLGRDLDQPSICDAELQEHSAMRVAGADFPILAHTPGKNAQGIVVKELNDEDVRRLRHYEGASAYELRKFDIEIDGQPAAADAFWCIAADWSTDGLWDFETWQIESADLVAEAAREIMWVHDQGTGQDPYADYPAVLMRAAARVAGQSSQTPVSLRSGLEAKDVSDHTVAVPYRGFFATETHSVRHRRFDGETGPPLSRAVFCSGDAVTVLPYDPVEDQVLVIEQFRAGPLARRDPCPWTLEPIAGRRDVGETNAQTARREALEEAKLTIDRLELIGGYYASPGCFAEYLTSYIGIADLADIQAGIFGLDSEDEDIRTHIISFEALMAAVQSGEAETGPLLISAMWLALNRDRLRAAAGAA